VPDPIPWKPGFLPWVAEPISKWGGTNARQKNTTVKSQVQSKSKRQKVFQTEKQHSKSTDPQKAHQALHGISEDIKDFSQNQGLGHRVQDLHFQRKQTKFRLHRTISI